MKIRTQTKKQFPKPSKILKQMNKNRRNLENFFIMKLCKYAPKGDEPVDRECTNCIENKCLVPNGVPIPNDMNRCYYPAYAEQEWDERKRKTKFKNVPKDKKVIDIINNYLSEILD